MSDSILASVWSFISDMGTWKRGTRGTRTVKGYMTDSQMAVMVTVLPIVMSSVKQKYGPSLNFPKTVSVDGGVA